MRITSVGKGNVNSSAGFVAAKAREINTTLKESTKKIEETIAITEEAVAKYEKSKNIDNAYKAAVSAIEDIQKFVDVFSKQAKFSVNKKIDRVVVKIIDVNTNSIIKEIPSSDVQEVQSRIRETMDLIFKTKK